MAYTRVPPKRSRTNIPRGQLQTTSEKDPISFANNISKGIENLFEELMTENFSNQVKAKDTQVQKVHRVLQKMKPKEAHTKTHLNENGKS